jgi:FMN-dependent NADH-azoreductase
VQDAVAGLRSQNSTLKVITRDLGNDPIPHLNSDSAAALRAAAPANEAQAAAAELSKKLIAEIEEADTVVIGAPMYNFGIPSTLKTRFDYVLRAGLTFRYTEAGPVGLLHGKRAIVIETRGGSHSDGPARSMDAQEPRLRALLWFIGIADVTFTRVERLAFGADVRQQAIDTARKELGHVIGPVEYFRAA